MIDPCSVLTHLPSNKEKLVKNWTKKALAPAGLLLCLGLLPGCIFVGDDDDDSAPVGTLELRWTIDGATDARDCSDLGVDRMELRIYDGSDLVDEVEPFCEDFAVSVDLFDGVYDGDATLVDSFDRAATLTEPLDAIDIREGTTLTIDVDFPIDSFL
jgi:hypothetical protein